MNKEKLKHLFDYLIVVFKHNYYWIGFSVFTYYLAFFLHTQKIVLRNAPIRVVLLKIFDSDLVLGLIVVIATYTLLVSLSNTRNLTARSIMFVSQTFITIFLTIGYLELDLALKDISIGSGALLFIIYLTVSNVLKGN